MASTKVGNLCEIASFSFYPSKNLGALGDAGLVYCREASLAEECGALRFYGQRERDVHSHVGLNSRMDELHAALLLELLPHLQGWVELRRRNAAYYDEAFRSTPLRRPTPIEGSLPSYHLYPIALPGRDELAAHLAERGVQTGIHYRTPIPQQPAFADCGDEVPEAGRLMEEILSLPVGPHVTEADAEHVARTVLEFLDARA